MLGQFDLANFSDMHLIGLCVESNRNRIKPSLARVRPLSLQTLGVYRLKAVFLRRFKAVFKVGAVLQAAIPVNRQLTIAFPRQARC
jgi:hypothetical protein